VVAKIRQAGRMARNRKRLSVQSAKALEAFCRALRGQSAYNRNQGSALSGAAKPGSHRCAWGWGARLTTSTRRFSGAFGSVLFFGLDLP